MAPADVDHETGSVTSADGTTIGYRRRGTGPALVLVHGAMMSAQNFDRLAALLADAHTVYVPDRRGRGSSGPYGDDYGIRREVEDLDALLRHSGAHDVFGLSAGALVGLRAAIDLPGLRRVVLYEPPLSFPDSSSVAWVPRYERELAAGRLAAAFVTLARGTGDSAVMRHAPRAVLVPLFSLAMRAQARAVPEGEVALADLVPTVHHDHRLVRDTEGVLEHVGGIDAPVLLLGGARSAGYLRTALDRLEAALAHVTRVELPGVGHLAPDNGGRPGLVAAEIRGFLAGG
jgi:pimeloyl-ACP methyl ester carboxylesterase